MTLPVPLIAVDVGNSRIKLGRFDLPVDDHRAMKTGHAADTVPGLPLPASELYLPLSDRDGRFVVGPLEKWIGDQSISTANWVLASVHRRAAQRLRELIGAISAASSANYAVRILTHENVPLTVGVEAPERVGLDRLVAALAANRLRRPGRAAIVIDHGSAITVDLVDVEGVFAGGAILPGMAMAARGLAEQTDALPLIAVDQWDKAPDTVGRSTEGAIHAGIFWGSAGAVRELVERISADLPRPPELFITGGAGRLLADALTLRTGLSIRHVPHLVLAGVAIVYCELGNSFRGADRQQG